MEFETVYALRRGHGSLSSGTAVYVMDREAGLVALRGNLTKIYDVPMDNLVALRPRTRVYDDAATRKLRQVIADNTAKS